MLRLFQMLQKVGTFTFREEKGIIPLRSGFDWHAYSLGIDQDFMSPIWQPESHVTTRSMTDSI